METSHKETVSKTVSTFLIEGHSISDIIEYLETEGILVKRAIELIDKAFADLEKAVNRSTGIWLAWCIEAQKHLYNKLESTGDYTGAIRAVTEISKLTAKIKVQVEPKEEKPTAKEAKLLSLISKK